MEDQDSRNNKGKGIGKHGNGVKEQKRIDEIKLKRAMQREEQLSNPFSSKKNDKAPTNDTNDEEVVVDPTFGIKNSKKGKSKAKGKKTSYDDSDDDY